MKGLFLLMFFPLISFGQTIHFKGEEIVYKGTFKNRESGADLTTKQLQEALRKAGSEPVNIESTGSKNKITTVGVMKLNSPFHVIRRLQYTLQLTPSDKGYGYQIENVSVKEGRRGGELKELTAKDLLEGREQTGPAAIANERLLNEIDMRFQKIITLLKNSRN